MDKFSSTVNTEKTFKSDGSTIFKVKKKFIFTYKPQFFKLFLLVDTRIGTVLLV